MRGTLAKDKNEGDSLRESDIFQGLNLDTKDQEYMLLAVSGLPQQIFDEDLNTSLSQPEFNENMPSKMQHHDEKPQVEKKDTGSSVEFLNKDEMDDYAYYIKNGSNEAPQFNPLGNLRQSIKDKVKRLEDC